MNITKEGFLLSYLGFLNTLNNRCLSDNIFTNPS